MRRIVSTLSLLALLWLAAGRAWAQTPEAAQSAWQGLLARDARAGFSPRTALLAGGVLRSEGASKERRAAAWLALGAGGSGELRAELLQTAKEGHDPERGAAILALGELGSGGESTLLELSGNADPALAATALLALLRTRNPELRRGVEQIAADAHDSRSAVAAQLLVFAGSPALAEPIPAVQRLLDLRWRAAREFGLVDGEAWKVLTYRALGRRAEFRSEVVLRAAGQLELAGVRDLLLGALLHGEGPARLRAAAHGMPRELALLVENGLWKPADLSEWAVLFDELEQQRLEAYALELFEAALAEPALRARALDLCSRSGAQELSEPIEAALTNASAEERVQLCRAMGESEDSAYLRRLGALAESPEPAVRAAAEVAQLLLGSRSGVTAVQLALSGGDAGLRAAVLAELAANARWSATRRWLEDEFAHAEGDERRTLALALAREGLREARAWCRAALESEPPPEPRAARELLAALSARLTPEDTDVVRAIFPREDTPENLALNVDLAVALIELGDPAAFPLLQAALWKGNFEVSLLSGALLAHVSGMHALRDEAANPPAGVRSADLRRVGFALGSWGGLSELESLAQQLRYNSGAPALQGGLLGFLSTRTH